ncbi:hypothetical protein ACTQ3M_07955 [Oscillospiraceae bacterium LCP25S3_E10]
MDIFKLGDKILALLEAVFGFWNNQISLVFAMLGQSPVSFKGGGPWAVIEGIEPVFVAVGSSLVVLFFVIGFCSESIDVKDEMQFAETKDYILVRHTQDTILASYLNDMSKYNNLKEIKKTRLAYDNITVQLSKKNTRFQYKLIKKGGRASA